MYWSGPIILAFAIYHLMQFTWGVGGTPFEELKPSENVVAGFSVWPIAVFYIIAVGMLMLHLYHGVWSMFQTLGANNSRNHADAEEISPGAIHTVVHRFQLDSDCRAGGLPAAPIITPCNSTPEFLRVRSNRSGTVPSST